MKKSVFEKINKLSELIKAGIADLKKVIEDDYVVYVLDSSVHHWPTWNDSLGGWVTHVSMTGAVMAKTLKCDPLKDSVPDHYGDGIYYRLRALDLIRYGQWRIAEELIRPDVVHHWDIPRPDEWNFNDGWTAKLFITDLETRILPRIEKVENAPMTNSD